MKAYRLPFADSLAHVPEKPELTAKRSAGAYFDFDVLYQVWPNRASLARSVRMQEKRECRSSDWKPCVPLRDGEGF